MHQTHIEVRWGELDPYDHVNHAVYLGYMEHARVRFLDELGWSMERLRDENAMIFVVGIDVRFRRPASAGDALTVTTRPYEVGGTRSRWRQTITRDGEMMVDATIHAGIVDLSGRPRRMPAGFKAALEAAAA